MRRRVVLRRAAMHLAAVQSIELPLFPLHQGHARAREDARFLFEFTAGTAICGAVAAALLGSAALLRRDFLSSVPLAVALATLVVTFIGARALGRRLARERRRSRGCYGRTTWSRRVVRRVWSTVAPRRATSTRCARDVEAGDTTLAVGARTAGHRAVATHERRAVRA
jgi:hypothetical protein